MEISFKITIPDMDKKEVEIECPVCKLQNWVRLGEIRRREYLVCRGCHTNILLEDHLGSVQRIVRKIKYMFKDWM
jgi:transposase-like protein